jgi:putative ABC transport system permease protein
MVSIALKMLFGDIAKTIGLVFGIAFSVLLMTQQGGFFIGLISRSASTILDARGADIWVMDPATESAETNQPMRAVDINRIAAVPGVLFADPFTKSQVAIKTLEGRTESAALFGVDDARLTGLTDRFILGSANDLRRPEAIAIDILGYTKLWPDTEPQLGREIELNDRRAVVAAITDARPGFSAPIVINARLPEAISYATETGAVPSFVIVGVDEGADAEAVAAAIGAQTGLLALTSGAFVAKTLGYVISSTGIAFSFGVVIALGAVVGIAIVGLTFNMFIADLTRQFAVLKAIGLTNGRIVLMVLAQGLVIGLVGYGIGLWLAAGFFDGVNVPTSDLKGFYLPWQIAVATACATLVICILATFVSLRRVLRLDPATVFRG